MRPCLTISGRSRLVAATTRTSILRTARRAHALNFVVLQHAQQLGLHGQRHFADFVEQRGSAVGVLENADFVLLRSGKRAFDVAK